MPSASWTASADAESVAFLRQTVSVSVSVEDREIAIVVRDDGSGLAPRDDSPGLGLGLSLIRRIADGFDHRVPPDGGTEVWMCFTVRRA